MSGRWRLGRAVIGPLLRFGLRLRIFGRQYVRPGSAQIIACNHTSHADPVIIGYACGIEVLFLAKAELFSISPILTMLLKSYNAQPVARGLGSPHVLKRCQAILRAGHSLVLFPEGTRSRTGRLQTLRPGAALLAIVSQVPIVPAFISGVRDTILPWIVDRDIVCSRATCQHPRPDLALVLNRSVTVRFREPLMPGNYRRSRTDYEALTGALHQALSELEAKTASDESYANDPLCTTH